MKFKNLNCEDAKEMGAKVRELTDIVCRKCDKHSDLVETINLQRAAIKQRDTEIDILIRKKESLRDEIEELQLKNSELEIELKVRRGVANSYKAEIERLNAKVDDLESRQNAWAKSKRELNELIKELKKNPKMYNADFVKYKGLLFEHHRNQAIKEFAERLKKMPSVMNCESMWMHLDIDDLVKEMTEGNGND